MTFEPLQKKYQIALELNQLRESLEIAALEAISETFNEQMASPAVSASPAPANWGDPTKGRSTTTPVQNLRLPTRQPVQQPAQAQAQQPAQTAPTQPTTTQQPAQAAPQASPQMMDAAVQAIAAQAKSNPALVQQFVTAVNNNDMKTVQALLQQASQKKIAEMYEWGNNAFAEQADIEALALVLKQLPAQDFDKVRYCLENGNFAEYDPAYEEKILAIYKEGAWDSFKQGISNIWKSATDFVAKYGPWAALGAVLGGPSGAAALPLLKAAINKSPQIAEVLRSMGTGAGHAIGVQPNVVRPRPINKSTNLDLSQKFVDFKSTIVPIPKATSDYGLTPEEVESIEKGATLNVTDTQGNIVQFAYRGGLLHGIKVAGQERTPAAPKTTSQPKPASKKTPVPQKVAAPKAKKGRSAIKYSHSDTGGGMPSPRPPKEEFESVQLKYNSVADKLIKEFYENTGDTEFERNQK